MKIEITGLDSVKRIGSDVMQQNVLDYVAESTRQQIHRWYAKLPEDWFDNPANFPDGTSRRGAKRSFMFPLSTAWKYVVRANGFDISFAEKRTQDGSSSNWGLRLQQYGGTISPVKKKALTIPVTNAARGRSAREFESSTDKKLFLVGREKGDKLGTLVWEDANKDLHAAYVLRKSSYVPSLKERRGHDALPSAEEISNWTREAFAEKIQDIFNS